jgi:hypothetical protein
MDNERAKKAREELIAAIEASDADQLHHLFQQYPNFPPADYWLSPVHTVAARAGLSMFRILVERFPQTKDWDLGHLGDPVGFAASQGDVPFLKFLLEDLGVKANTGRFMKSPVT